MRVRRARLARSDRWDQRATPGLKVSRDRSDRRVQWDPLARLDPREPRGTRDRKARKVSRDRRELRDQRVRRD